MMKPNFLGNESKIGDDDLDFDFDFDFVLVEKDFEGTNAASAADDDDDNGDDGDSYDYCEDVCSILSTNEQENGDYLLSDSLDSLEKSSVTGLKDSILIVPSVLLKDLDDAHAAAKLTQITDLDTTTDLEENDTRSSVFLFESKKDKVVEQHTSSVSSSNIGSEDSSSLSTGPFETPIVNEISGRNNTAIIILSAVKTKNHSSLNETTTPYSNVTVTTDMNFSKEKNNTNAPTSISASRTSNKKRRKKLRMLKKAQSATATAEKYHQQVASSNSPSSPGIFSKKFLQRSSSSKKHSTPSRCASKKVANIAVACAMESMSNYRDELFRQEKQQFIGS